VTLYFGSLFSNNWETDGDLHYEAGKCRCRIIEGIDTKILEKNLKDWTGFEPVT
jgi:hypothetical protein